MKKIRLFLILMLMALICIPAYASVGIKVNGTYCGTATDINWPTNTTVTTDGSTYNVSLTSTGVVSIATSGTMNNTVLNNCSVGITTAAAANITTLNANVTTLGVTNVTGNLTTTNIAATGLLAVTGNTTISGTSTPVILNVTGNGTVNTNLKVGGTTLLVGNATLNGTIALNNAQICGNATLLNGTILVNSTAVTANSIVLLSRIVNGTGTQGNLNVINASVNAGANFTVASSAATDNSTVRWLIIN